jgi:hypothetical protein
LRNTFPFCKTKPGIFVGVYPIRKSALLRYTHAISSGINQTKRAKEIEKSQMGWMNVRKAYMVTFRFWLERQVSNARKPKRSSSAPGGGLYFGKRLGKTIAEGRD